MPIFLMSASKIKSINKHEHGESIVDAIANFRKQHPTFSIEAIDDKVVIAFCEHSGEPIFEGDEYVMDEQDLYYLKKYVPTELLNQ